MGVYLPNIKKPNNCGRCDLRVSFLSIVTDKCVPANREILAYEYEFDGFPEWCPLVEVKTPHGRLIDIDAIDSVSIGQEDFVGVNEKNCYGIECVLCGDIDEAPSIIEAED